MIKPASVNSLCREHARIDGDMRSCYRTAMKKKTPIALKQDPDLLKEVDAFRDKLPFPVTRTAFIETAMREKLERETKRGRK